MTQEEQLCFKMDPMLIDLVLETIFGACDVPTLKNCRLVSKRWFELSLKSWRKKAVLQLGPSSHRKLEFRAFLNLVDPRDDEDDFLQLSTTAMKPFNRYSVEYDEWKFYGRKEPRVQEYILWAITNCRARFVKIIWNSELFFGFKDMLSELNSDSLETLEVTWSTLGLDIEAEPLNRPNIKRLNLTTNHLLRDHSPNRSLWEFLLSSCHKLEALSVGYNLKKKFKYSDYSKCLDDRFQVVNFLRNKRQSEEDVFPLREFEMIDVHRSQPKNVNKDQEYRIVKTLAGCKFPLQRLSIHVGFCGDEVVPPIVPLLKSWKDTLEYLRASIHFSTIYFSADNRYDELNKGRVKSDLRKRSFMKRICMKVLKELHLLNGLEWALFLLSHLEVPQLQKLVVDYDKDRNPYHEDRYGLIAVSFSEEAVYERMETFALLDNFIIPESKTILEFARMMPSLVHLTIPLDKKTFTLICKHFRGLKTLHIIAAQSDYEELDDEGLTGVSKKPWEDGVVPSRPPNITDLELLSSLTISCERQLRRNDVKFTEHSVIHGFLQLPKLFNLSVAFKELSEEMKEKLLSHVMGRVEFQGKPEPPHDSFAVEITPEVDAGTAGSSDSGESYVDVSDEDSESD